MVTVRETVMAKNVERFAEVNAAAEVVTLVQERGLELTGG